MTHNDEIWKKMTTPIEIDVGNTSIYYDDIQNIFNAHLSNGDCVRCPMSGTIHNMPYRRSISKGMARALKLLYRIQVQGINDGNAPNSQADFTKLRYWGLIKQQTTSNHWVITPFGISVVADGIRVAKYAIVVNNQFKEFMGDSVSIDEVLSK